MWKMYLPKVRSADSQDFWDETWDEEGAFVDGFQNDRICENQGSIWRLLSGTLLPDRLFLEGGCGPANWVRYFHARGYRALGIDFAARTVERVRTLAPEIDVRVGDVTALPLPDGSVHVYYSGGVVEHFETGPQRALREARRVIAEDGWFLCSVPEASTVRRHLLFKRPAAEEVPSPAAGPPPEGHAFFQYAFTRPEFSELLDRAGFRVQSTFGYSLVWGLMELPGVDPLVRTARRLLRRQAAAPAGPPANPSPEKPATGTNGSGGPVSALRRLMIERLMLREDTSVPVLGPLLGFMLEHCPNMRLYVARPR